MYDSTLVATCLFDSDLLIGGSLARLERVERSQLSIMNGPELLDRLAQEILVMADDQDGALELLNGLRQHVDRFVVQVVGGLVHDDQMRLLPAHDGERQPTLLTARQVADLHEGNLAQNAEAAQVPPTLDLGRAGKERLEPLDGAHTQVQLVDRVLGEVSDTNVGVEPDQAINRLQLAKQHLHQR